MGAIFGIAFLVFLAMFVLREEKKQNIRTGEKIKDAEPLMRALIEKHALQLKIKKEQLSPPGRYGAVDKKRWEKEIHFFISNVLEPKIGGIGGDLYALAEDLILKATGGPAPFITFSSSLTPIEYEHYVAATLRKHGWDAQTTKGSGDQGVDVIARKNGMSVVIQCKLYSKPVGNAAVQEALAGRAFEKADYAAVVTNAEYTPAARQLAHSASVLLLHDAELADLETKITVNA